MTHILITPRSLTSAPPPELSALTDAGFELVFCAAGQMPDEAELLHLIPRCTGWLAGVEPVSEAVIAAATDLRVIARNGSGVDNLPLALLNARGIAVERAVGANATGVAELTLGLILAACRHLPPTAMGVRAGSWPRFLGREIEGATIGIVGMGAIGSRVAGALASMGARVLITDPAEPPLGMLRNAVRYVPLTELVERSEIITLHCPLTPDGSALIDAAMLARMRPNSLLVNTARAQLVNEDAVLTALNTGHLSAYATDVFAVEPPVDLALASHAKVIATSHIGGLTEGSVTRATEAAVAGLMAHLSAPPSVKQPQQDIADATV